MKKVVVLLIFVGIGVCAWFLYEPYLKDRVDPLWEQIAGKPDNPVEGGKAAPKPPTPKPKPPTPEPPKDPVVSAPPKPAPAPEPPKSEIDLLVEKQYPMPQLQPLMVIVNNWNSVPPRAYPEKVVTKDVIQFSLVGPNGQPIGSSNVAPGNEVKPISLIGSTLHVANLANPGMKSQIAVDKTDFKEQIEQRYAEFTGKIEKRILAMRAGAKKRLLEQPDQVASARAGASTWHDDGDPRFHPVKASLAAGEVTAFNIDEAVGFRWNGREKITTKKFKGTYDTVTVNYEANTIFGVFPGEMMCLLQGGKVVGWVDPYTMEERI